MIDFCLQLDWLNPQAKANMPLFYFITDLAETIVLLNNPQSEEARNHRVCT